MIIASRRETQNGVSESMEREVGHSFNICRLFLVRSLTVLVSLFGPVEH